MSYKEYYALQGSSTVAVRYRVSLYSKDIKRAQIRLILRVKCPQLLQNSYQLNLRHGKIRSLSLFNPHPREGALVQRHVYYVVKKTSFYLWGRRNHLLWLISQVEAIGNWVRWFQRHQRKGILDMLTETMLNAPVRLLILLWNRATTDYYSSCHQTA